MLDSQIILLKDLTYVLSFLCFSLTAYYLFMFWHNKSIYKYIETENFKKTKYKFYFTNHIENALKSFKDDFFKYRNFTTANNKNFINEFMNVPSIYAPLPSLIGSLSIFNSSLKDAEKNKTHFIDLMIVKKMKANDKCKLLLSLSISISSVFYNFFLDISFLVALSIPLFLIAFLSINNKIFYYRVTKGLYGDSDYEASELLSFINSTNKLKH